MKREEKSYYDNRTKRFVAIIGFLGIIVGTFGTILLKPNVETAIKRYPYDAKVDQYEGVFVFIRSSPQNNNYKTIAIAETNSLMRAVNASKGKRGFWNVLANASESFLNDLDFDNRLKEMIVEAKRLHPEVQGLIFIDDLTRCKLIRFN